MKVIKKVVTFTLAVTILLCIGFCGRIFYANAAEIKKTVSFEAIGANIDVDPVRLALEGTTEAKLVYVDETYAIVDFSEYVKGISRYNFTNSETGNFSLGVYKNKEMTMPVTSTEFVKKVWVKFYDKKTRLGFPFTENGQKLIVNGNYNGNIVKDMWLKPIKDACFSIVISVDTKSPQVVSLEVESDSTIGIEFDEDVEFSLSNVDILDEQRNEIDGIRLSSFEDSRYIINLGKSYAGKSITVSIKNVKDLAVKQNMLLKYSKELFIVDKNPPRAELTVEKCIPGEESVLYIYFNEALNAEGLDMFEFYLQNADKNIKEKLTGKHSFFKNDSSIVIPLTNEEKDKINSGYNIFLKNIEDKNKNLLDGQLILNSKIISFDSIANNIPKVIRIEAQNNRKVAVTFNQYLSIVDKSAFKINGYIPENMEISINNEGNTVVILAAQEARGFASDLNGDATLSIAVNSSARLENEFGISAESKEYTSSTIPAIQDKMAPALKRIIPVLSENGSFDTVIMEYDENIDFTKLSISTYSIQGREIYRVYTNSCGERGMSAIGKFVVIELKPLDSKLENKSMTLQITQVLDIYDMHDNRLLGNNHLL